MSGGICLLTSSHALDVLTLWHGALNHHAEKFGLPCKFSIQQPGEGVPKLVYLPQGRVAATKFKKVTPTKKERDLENIKTKKQQTSSKQDEVPQDQRWLQIWSMQSQLNLWKDIQSGNNGIYS